MTPKLHPYGMRLCVGLRFLPSLHPYGMSINVVIYRMLCPCGTLTSGRHYRQGFKRGRPLDSNRVRRGGSWNNSASPSVLFNKNIQHSLHRVV